MQINDPSKQRRASDRASADSVATPEAIWEVLIEIRDRVAAMETNHMSQSEAFMKDDLGKPDYHGHRKAHIKQVKAAEIVENYKMDVTKKILGYLAVFIIGITATGFLDAIRIAFTRAP